MATSPRKLVARPSTLLLVLLLSLLTFLPFMTTATETTTKTEESSSKLYQAFDFVKGFLVYQQPQQQHTHNTSTSTRTGLRLIGAGFSRTGTKSTETALQRLGHKVYDTRSMLEYSHHVPRWIQGAKDWKENNDLTLIDELLQEIEEAGYTATLDFPMNLFALALAELRPDAKVLMTVRDTEEKWFASWLSVNKILSHFVARPWNWIIGDFDFPAQLLRITEGLDWITGGYPNEYDRPLPWFEVARVHNLERDDLGCGKKEWIQLHKDFQKKLQRSLRGNRLLVFNVKQGWKPLLNFLEIKDEALAADDFPNVNDIKSLEVVRQVMDILAIGLPLWIAGVLLGLKKFVGFLLRRWRTKDDGDDLKKKMQ